jgi:hypothetical protein
MARQTKVVLRDHSREDEFEKTRLAFFARCGRPFTSRRVKDREGRRLYPARIWRGACRMPGWFRSKAPGTCRGSIPPTLVPPRSRPRSARRTQLRWSISELVPAEGIAEEGGYENDQTTLR